MKCIPTSEATSFPLFIPPPLDGSLTIPEIYDFHYSNNPDQPLFIYDDGGVQTIPWRQAVKAIHRAARMVQGIPKPHAQIKSEPPVVAILAVTGDTNVVNSYPPIMLTFNPYRPTIIFRPYSWHYASRVSCVSDINPKFGRRRRQLAAKDESEICPGQ